MYNSQGNLTEAWYVLGESKEFTNETPVKKEIMEIPFAIWRTTDGEVKALVDRCIHRNAPLSEGKIKNNCLVCPYHGWEFNAEGQCVKIPAEGSTCSQLPKHKVKSYLVTEMDNLVLIWMGKGNPPDKAPFKVRPKSGKGWKHFTIVTEFNCNVSNLVENFMDVPHTAYIHKGLFREESELHIKAQVERTKDSVRVFYRQSQDSISFFSKILNPEGKPMTHTDEFFMPNIVRVNYSFGKYAFWTVSQCVPVNPTKTISYTTISYNFGRFNLFAGWILPWYVRKVLNQDVWIMQKQTETIQKFGGESTFRSTQADTMLLYIQALRDTAIKEEEDSQIKYLNKELEFWV